MNGSIEWFTDLSSKFLACPAAKLLILAGKDRAYAAYISIVHSFSFPIGTDRLDKPLMIGQMQGNGEGWCKRENVFTQISMVGKFQLHIIPEAGHFLQEDAPVNTARSLVEFWRRNKRLVLPPKVQIK